MDSKQIFRTYIDSYYKLNWLDENDKIAQREQDVKWYYCGVGKDFNSDLVKQTLDKIFTNEKNLFLCISGTKSYSCLKSEVIDIIGSTLHKKEIGLMNESCDMIVHFNIYGTFKYGIVPKLPKSRLKPKNQITDVSFNAHIVQTTTRRYADLIGKILKQLSKDLSKDYGGNVEHLWIDLVLTENGKIFPFRVQKRVTERSTYTEYYSYNVAHYSLKPDFKILEELSLDEEICSYLLQLLYQSTLVLEEKRQKLKGFDVVSFRSNFLSICQKLGYFIESN